MKKIALLFISIIALAGCKKNDNSEPVTTPKRFSNKIVLDEPKVMGDSVKLSWSILDTSNFVHYAVKRRNGDSGLWVTVKLLNSKQLTTSIDKDIPYVPTVKYRVEGYLGTINVISSNTVEYTRPDIPFIDVVLTFDVQYNSSDKTLYFFEPDGKITIYSIEQRKILKAVNTNVRIGYADFGTYNGKKELYVPREDGWVFIYDAITLEKIDQISTGTTNLSVFFNNNNLYISTGGFHFRPLKVYSRESKSKIAEAGDSGSGRIKQVPNTNLDLLEMSLDISPVDQNYLRFNSSGSLISQSDDQYHGTYPLDANIFEFFPDGSKYITSSEGAIYSKDMTYEAKLPRGNLSYTTFVVDGTEKRIYAGCVTKGIKVYSATTYQEIKTIKTNAYPYKMFDLGDKLLCISSPEPMLCASCTYWVQDVVIEFINKN
jgi:hypothetical protein